MEVYKNKRSKIYDYCEKLLAQSIYLLFKNVEKYLIKDKVQLYLARCYKEFNFKKAFYYYIEYQKEKPDDIDLSVEIAQFCTDNNKIALSSAICREQLKNHPNRISFMLIECQNYIKTGDFEKTIDYAKKVLDIDRTNEYAHKFLCEAYCKTGKNKELDEEINQFDFSSNSEFVLKYIAQFYLKSKKLKIGLKALNRLLKNNLQTKCNEKHFHEYYKHLWNNENLKNKKFLIFDYHCGYGDYIMLVRFLPVLAKTGAKIVIEANDNLFDLYKYNFPKFKVIKTMNKEYKYYDYTYHLELIFNLVDNIETFPSPQGYLKVNPKIIKKMEYTGIFNTSKLKIGISYKSNKGENDIRAININKIIPILGNINYQFYAITDDKRSNEEKEILQKYNVIDCAKYINNAHDTAAIMKNLDLVISIDSFPIHLAGALGVKAFLLLSYCCNWRWFDETEKTAWYDSVKIFKQTKQGQWNDVIEKVVLELNNIYEFK